MNSYKIKDICNLRLIIGYLGEKDQKSWWNSTFFSKSSKAFLSPTYPKSFLLAQYNGVCKAACLVHDEHIGIGAHYHLYRLPDSIEKSLPNLLKDADFSNSINQILSTKENAIQFLENLYQFKVKKSEGPTSVGDYSDEKLGDLLNTIGSHYLHAMKTDYKSFPYLKSKM